MKSSRTGKITLIEIIIMLAILGIVAAGAIPKLLNYEEARSLKLHPITVIQPASSEESW